MVDFNGSFTEGVGCFGFCIFNHAGELIVEYGGYYIGFANNHAECLAVLKAVNFIKVEDLLGLGDYIIVKGDS